MATGPRANPPTPTPADLARHLASYREVREAYRSFATAMGELLTRLASDQGLHAARGDVMVSARAKSIESFGEKLVRPGKSYTQPLSQMTDLCGARIVVPTTVDRDRLCARIEELARDGVLEIDWPNSRHGRPEEGSEATFDYRSVHYVVSLPAEGDSEVLGVTIPRELRRRREATSDARRDIERGRVHPAIYRGEVQVRTFLEHCWANEGHDRLYKAADDVPASLKRQFARVSALLEEVDEGLREVRRGMAFFQRQQAARRTPKTIDAEIGRRRALMEALARADATEATERAAVAGEVSPDRNELRFRLARLHAVLGRWEEVATVADEASSNSDSRLAMLRGEAAMRLGQFAEAETWLRRAATLSPQDAEPLCALGDLRLARDRSDSAGALDAFARAAQLDPDHPRVLRGLIERRLVVPDSAPLDLVHPLAQRGRESALRLAESGLYLPWAYFDLAVFDACLVAERSHGGDPTRTPLASAITWLFLGIHHCIAFEPLLENERGLRQLREAGGFAGSAGSVRVSGLWWTAYLAAVRHAGVARSRDELFPRFAVASGVGAGAVASGTPAVEAHRELYDGRQVVILAGSTSRLTSEEAHELYGEAVRCAFAGFSGVLIHPGTGVGVGALIDIIREVAAPAMREAIYLPVDAPPAAASPLGHARTVFRTLAPTYSIFEPLLYCAHLLEANPAEVRLLGIGGGDIAEFEYLHAATMGWHVGLVRGSGRSAGRVAAHAQWGRHRCIHDLPLDPWVMHLFVQPLRNDDLAASWNEPAWTAERERLALLRPPAAGDDGGGPVLDGAAAPGLDGFVEAISQLVHHRYLGAQAGAREAALAPQLRRWELLGEEFRESNRDHVRALPRLLKLLGYRIAPKTSGGGFIDPFAAGLAPFRALRQRTGSTAPGALLAAVPPEFLEAAKFEHARWVVERMVLLGWRHGRVRDNAARVHPDLVAWEHLDDATRLYDLEPLDAMPRHLDALGYAVVKESAGGGAR